MKKRLRLLKSHGTISPGEYTFSGKLADHLLRTGKAVEVTRKPAFKQEKFVPENKEEKFIPTNKEVVPISKLNVSAMTSAELKDVIANDERVTARRMAQKELDSR